MQHPPEYQQFKNIGNRRMEVRGGHSRKIALVSMKGRKFRLTIGVS